MNRSKQNDLNTFSLNLVLLIIIYTSLKHKNDVSNMVGCLQVVKIYSFMKEIKVDIRVSYIVKISLC